MLGLSITKANPNHDELGRFATADGGMGLGGMFGRIRQPDGGFTYQPLTGAEPKTGYALSIFPDRSFATDAKDLSLDDLDGYLDKNADLLADPNNYVGGWHDPATGKVFLDVSRVVTDEYEAATLARRHDQIAYFDLGRGASVTVNPDATSGGQIKKGEYRRSAGHGIRI